MLKALQDPEIEEERDMMAGRLDMDGRLLRKDGPFPMVTS